MNVYLDDVRPCPTGWVLAKTIQEVQDALRLHNVQRLSLDHDLGACDDCMGGRTWEEWLDDAQGLAMPNCSHVGTGYDLCLWMAEKGIWPVEKPTVHSANPVGRDRMLGVIDRYFPEASNEV